MAAKLAIVTGTSRGIGTAVARQLVAAGWTVIGVARGASVVTDDNYHHVTVDLGDTAAMRDCLTSSLVPWIARDTWSRLGLVNNAASPDLLGVGERADPVEALRVYAVNTVAPVWLMSLVARERIGEIPLRIVNLSSGAGVHAIPGVAVYGGTKAALRQSSAILAAEWSSTVPHAPARRDIAVRIYAPGVVETSMQVLARGLDRETLPWGDTYHEYVRRGYVLDPSVPAAEIVSFLETSEAPAFSEAAYRYG